MKKYTVTLIYEEHDEKREFDTFDEAHDYAMERYFWTALGFMIDDPNGTCVECYV